MDPVPAAVTPAQNESEAGIRSPTTVILRKSFAPGQIFIGIVAVVPLCLFYQWCSQLGTTTHYHHTRQSKADEAWVYRNGHLAEFKRDRNLDGEWDEWGHYERGQVVRAEVDNNFDGKPDEWLTYANRVLVKLEKDADFNGIPDMFCTYKYRGFNKWTLRDYP